jgi:SAM-dependent methyltransferase
MAKAISIGQLLDDTLCDVVRDVSSVLNGALVQAEHPWADAQLAGLYDVFAFDDDLPLYSELAKLQGGRLLEVACGSGRVLVPLVRGGCEVIGIDISPHMLDLARAKLDAEPALAGTARLVQADMREFELAEHDLDMAIVAVKSFAYLTELGDQLRCLRRIAAHLRPGGLLAIDFLHPRPEWVGAATGSMRDDLLQRVPSRGFTLSRVESVVSTDLARQVRVIRSIYELIDDRGAVIEKRFVEWPYRWTYRFEAQHLLERAGFEVEAVYGGYRREPFASDSAAMLFLARTPTRP